MDCKTCKENRATIPYLVHEGAMARLERVNRRWFIAWLITFVLFIGCIAGFIWYESQFEDAVTTTTEITQENENGYNNFIGEDGDIYNGKADDQDNQN